MGLLMSKRNEILDDLFCKLAVSPAKSCYLALSTTTPNDFGGNFTEPDLQTGYKRALLGKSDDASTQKMGNADGGQIKNNAAITFPLAGDSWGTVTYFGLFSTQYGGTPYYTAQISSPIVIPQGYLVSLNINALKVSLN